MNKHMFFLPFAVAVLSIGATPIRAEEAAIDKGFAEALLKFDAAQHDLENGKSETTKAIWSHGDAITLSGGFGGHGKGLGADWPTSRLGRRGFLERDEYLRATCGTIIW